MTWRESLRRVQLADGRQLIGASFRGVPFLVESAERSGGRRTVVHEFPLRDEPVIEDLGRTVRTLSIEGYVLGDSYLAQRDALLAALEDEAGPGELVHPYYGTVRAVCSSMTTRESVAEGGVARFALEFTVVPPAPPAPVESPDLPAAVTASAAAAQEATETELVATYNTDDQPGYAVASLAEEITDVAEGLEAALLPVASSTQELARLKVSIASITSDAIVLARNPADAVAAFAGVLEDLADTAAAAPGRLIAALIEAYDTDEQPAAQGDSAIREQERTNQRALADALRRVLLIEAARLVPTVVYETLQDALSDRDAVAERLEAQAATAGDTAYPALVQLRSDLLRAVPGDQELARLVTLAQSTAVPSLLLAYRLYGALDQEQAIVDRNNAQHPAFLAGDLQVLSNVG